MRALFSDRPGEVVLREVPDPVPGAGEVVVRVRAALTCGTDFKLVRRGHPKVPFPARLGHEFAGVVERVGPGTSFAAGDRVVPAVSGPCGACPDCLAHEENLCRVAFEQTAWGGFADLVLLPPRVVTHALRRIPESLSNEAAALLDPVASVVRGIARTEIRAGEMAIVVGSGPIALIWNALLGRRGCQVRVIGRRERQLALQRQAGALTVDLRSSELSEAAEGWTGGRGARLVVDTTGDPDLIGRLLPLVARGGEFQLFAGMPRDASVTFPASRIHYDEISVAGSFHYTPRQAAEALDLLAQGALPVASLISARRPLEDFAEVFAGLSYGDAMKTALIP
jgi:L-iditol 2-dehydrogenase